MEFSKYRLKSRIEQKGDSCRVFSEGHTDEERQGRSSSCVYALATGRGSWKNICPRMQPSGRCLLTCLKQPNLPSFQAEQTVSGQNICHKAAGYTFKTSCVDPINSLSITVPQECALFATNFNISFRHFIRSSTPCIYSYLHHLLPFFFSFLGLSPSINFKISSTDWLEISGLDCVTAFFLRPLACCSPAAFTRTLPPAAAAC